MARRAARAGEWEYNSLSSESQKSYDQQTFVERNQNIYEGVEASDFQIEVTDETDNELTYNVKMNTIAGGVTFENKTTIEDGKIVWAAKTHLLIGLSKMER